MTIFLGQKSLVYGRANTAAVSGKNHLCNGVFIIAGEGNTELGGSAQFGAVTSTECFDGTTSRIIPEMDISNIFSGLYQHSAVIVQKDNQSGDDIWVLGGRRVLLPAMNNSIFQELRLQETEEAHLTLT